MVKLRDLYLVELSDLLDAEEQILRELPVMSARATSQKLRALFDDHYRETQRHIERLESLFERMDERARPTVCHGVRGLIEEARERHSTWDRDDVLDAALIGAAQRIEHYEIAGYGCARTYASALGDTEAAQQLQQTLDEERAADERLAALVQREITQSARMPPREAKPTSLMPGVWVTETAGFAAVPPRAHSDMWSPENELMVARGEPDWRSERAVRDHEQAGGSIMKERQRNEDARGGDVIVNDSIASGKPDLPIDRDLGRETNVAINADELGRNKVEEQQPVEKRD